ncbi:MAG: SipW-dependent-type signal peptide-containing protein [Eggerthellaceae bacterium]|jgi:predicted ribosomally synthesized peptide with SipW-like signal peptide|nr:SipW-dependent-type signal peptide-containing protein [Eggerthellaceae bacterium]MDR2715352.1 SipW-dependent-type signal peptide-containing protein [Coriobacteriaceae bacterium]
MKQFTANKKALALTLLALALTALMAWAVTLAFFTDYDEVENVFTLGKIKVSLEEPGWTDGDGLDLVPGSVREKDPTVTALEGQSYMRIRMELLDGDGTLITDPARIDLILATLFYDTAYGSTSPHIVGAENYATTDLAALVAANKVYAEYNKDDFTFAGREVGKPGVRYYNYRYIFDTDDPAHDTAVLFTTVVIPKDWANAEVFTLHGSTYETTPAGSVEVVEEGKGYRIVLKAEAIQAAEMPSAEAAFEALNDATGVTIG